MRILGIDYGDARAGLALSDPLGWTAKPLPHLKGGNPKKLVTELQGVIRENGVERIVLGFPKNMNGTIGPRGELTKELAALIEEKTGLKVVLWDERLTTVSATQIMNQTNVRGKKRKEQIDSLSAVLILETYLRTLS